VDEGGARFASAADPARLGPVEQALGAHQFLGGVVTDLAARATFPNLFAAGDVADSVQGADRINGSGIMEALVFGAFAGAGAAAARAQDARPALPAAYARPSRHGIDRLTEWRRRLQTEMDDMLAVRDRARLAGLETRLAGNLDALERGGLAGETPAAARALHELRSALFTSLEVVRASLRREPDLGLFVTR
jgi:aspartate oxidase